MFTLLIIYPLHTRGSTTMSDLYKCSENLELNHYNFIVWRNLTRVDLPAVDAYKTAIGNENHPIGAGSAATIRTRPQNTTRKTAIRLDRSFATTSTTVFPRRTGESDPISHASVSSDSRCRTTGLQ